ncbi:MAG TPA: hypothetical protein VIK28_00810, partial [Sedimentisphaerales bacterium]
FLHIDGFSEVMIGTNITGELLVTNPFPSIIILERDCDILGTLSLSNTSDVTISASPDDANAMITTLNVEDNLGPRIPLRFAGSGGISIEHVNEPSAPASTSGGSIDLSNLTGGFDNNFAGAEFGNGFDFLVGDLHRASNIRLASTPGAASEILFGSDLHTIVTIYNLDRDDHIDLGQLGVSSFADLTIIYSSGVSHIRGNTFSGEIDVASIDLTLPGIAASYIDFNGHIG